MKIEQKGGLCKPHNLNGLGKTSKSLMLLTLTEADATLCLRAAE